MSSHGDLNNVELLCVTMLSHSDVIFIHCGNSERAYLIYYNLLCIFLKRFFLMSMKE